MKQHPIGRLQSMPYHQRLGAFIVGFAPASTGKKSITDLDLTQLGLPIVEPARAEVEVEINAEGSDFKL